MVDSLIDSAVGYPGLWFACAGSGLVIPMPEDLPLLYAGVRVAAGEWMWLPTLAVAWCGVGTRDLCSWVLGRALGRVLWSGRMRWLVGDSQFARARAMVEQRGASAVLVGRFMVGFRAPVFMVAGALGVPLGSFLAYDALGLTLTVPLTVGLGYWFGAPVLDQVAAQWSSATAIALLLGIVAIVVLAWRARKAALAAAMSEESEPAAK